MKLRCIHRTRQESDTVILTSTFECQDKDSYLGAANRRNKKPRNVCIYSDCACIYNQDNMQHTHLGVGVYTTIDGVFSAEYSGFKYIGQGTVPKGEWQALLYAMNVAKKLAAIDNTYTFTFFADAQTVVRCFNDQYTTSRKFKGYYTYGKIITNSLGIRYKGVFWLRREHNKEADKLSKEALNHLLPEPLKHVKTIATKHERRRRIVSEVCDCIGCINGTGCLH